PYWADSAIFVVEDDSQAGLDHVDGHRAPIQIISPYAQHGVVPQISGQDLDRIAEALEERLLRQLERRGGRYAGVF
ncbi:hypothetical protein ACFQ1S_34960, partial [Kibdelosporangium lantanae]